ncbi:MAG: hypothetical protein CMD22_05075 [Flavobacteriales bacterium]|nr:hypothetical protein [Flavobacteriales bacterium]
MLKNKRKKKKQLNKYLVLTSISFQMGVIFYLGAYAGSLLDNKYNLEKKYFTILFILLALFVSIYNITKQLKNLDNE